MKIYLTNQNSKFTKHLEYFKKQGIIKYVKTNLNEKITKTEIDCEFSKINLDFFYNYEIFPGNIIESLCQWNHENRKMKIGDTIVQQAFLPPIKGLSQKVIFAVRINEIIDQPERKGFSYETLDGHVEKGISIFTIEKNMEKSIFKIHTFSKPGNLFTSLVGPIFSVPYQSFCTKKALYNVKERIEKIKTQYNTV
ncbi:MAG: hypothetical protein CL853_06260 [Crocinitomicaceae bacterium]|nr:hypothetical protein [Crocinitomicaceae bacterium]|tara:strand:- start:53 stop:637 length:585 start_codon:yes stop_codon:yes gene_type:complete